MGAKPLRDEMPEVAGFIDALRDAFGRESIDPSLSRGLDGEPGFFAAEAGHRVGTAPAHAETGQIWCAVRMRDRY
jgi:hypothetical protein